MFCFPEKKKKKKNIELIQTGPNRSKTGPDLNKQVRTSLDRNNTGPVSGPPKNMIPVPVQTGPGPVRSGFGPVHSPKCNHLVHYNKFVFFCF